ncbi:MAG: class II aldolase/adducin family protein [Blastocatellia bacterium]
MKVHYFRPGSTELAAAVEEMAPRHHCLLMRNHGVICCGASLNEAVDRTEELEATARLFFQLRGEQLRRLTAAEVREIEEAYGPNKNNPTA